MIYLEVLGANGVTSVITIGTAFGMNQFLEYGADSATMLNQRSNRQMSLSGQFTS